MICTISSKRFSDEYPLKSFKPRSLFLGVDTGGTFTDFVLYDGIEQTIHKVLSTPHAPEEAILKGVDELGIKASDYSRLILIHGSTVATNAVLEGKGVKVLYITNRGMGDLLTIGRQVRNSLYDLQPQHINPPVAAELCQEVGCRVDKHGDVIQPLSDDDRLRIKASIEMHKPDAIAINLLFSYLNEHHEKEIEALIPPPLFVSRSSAILPEYREYERGMTTWLNAYVGPLVEGYLSRLRNALPGATISVMQSSGNTIAAELAGKEAVHMLLSGPAGGLAGAKYIGEIAGHFNLLTFDMGGTSTDVSLIQGELKLTSEGKVADYPVSVSMVDMHTIGAGGGSIAWIDAGGLLQVGPQSAGASPGPACYGKGGTLPTVTDANLILGRLQPESFLGGDMRLDIKHAYRALTPIAEALSCTINEAAEGVIRVANEHMARALRVMSVQRGIDPATTTLVSFGGAGGLHVCALADALGLKQAMVPINAGVLSAFGMLVAPRGRQLSRTINANLLAMTPVSIRDSFQSLLAQGIESVRKEGIDVTAIKHHYSLDLRYKGQSYTLNTPLELGSSMEQCAEQFHQLHFNRYGHNMDLPIEIVNLRLQITAPQETINTEFKRESVDLEPKDVTLPSGENAKIYNRMSIPTAYEITGTAIITETVSTTYISNDWKAVIDATGNLVLSCDD